MTLVKKGMNNMRFREVGRRMEHIETRVEEKEKKINKSIFPNFFNDLPNNFIYWLF